jgi:hypothetical protein
MDRLEVPLMRKLEIVAFQKNQRATDDLRVRANRAKGKVHTYGEEVPSQRKLTYPVFS